MSSDADADAKAAAAAAATASAASAMRFCSSVPSEVPLFRVSQSLSAAKAQGVEEVSIVCEGELLKKSLSTVATRHLWHRRYVVLTWCAPAAEANLILYAQPDDAWCLKHLPFLPKQLDKVTKDKADINRDTRIDIDKNHRASRSSHSNRLRVCASFRFPGGHQLVYQFQASNPEEQEKWITAFQWIQRQSSEASLNSFPSPNPALDGTVAECSSGPSASASACASASASSTAPAKSPSPAGSPIDDFVELEQKWDEKMSHVQPTNEEVAFLERVMENHTVQAQRQKLKEEEAEEKRQQPATLEDEEEAINQRAEVKRLVDQLRQQIRDDEVQSPEPREVVFHQSDPTASFAIRVTPAAATATETRASMSETASATTGSTLRPVHPATLSVNSSPNSRDDSMSANMTLNETILVRNPSQQSIANGNGHAISVSDDTTKKDANQVKDASDSNSKGDTNPTTSAGAAAAATAAAAAKKRQAAAEGRRFALNLLTRLSAHNVWWLIVFAVQVPLYMWARSSSFDKSTATFALAHFMISILCRNEHVIMAIYTLSMWMFQFIDSICIPTRSRRMRLVSLNLRYYYWCMIHYIGGLHVAAGVTGFAWTCYYWHEEIRPLFDNDDGLSITLYLTMGVLCIQMISALPPVRWWFHNHFESVHRLMGWTLLGLLVIHVSLTFNKVAPIRVDPITFTEVMNNSSFWMVAVLVFLAVWPWYRTVRIPFQIDVPLLPVDQVEFEKLNAALKATGKKPRKLGVAPPGLEGQYEGGIGCVITMPDVQYGKIGQALAGTGTRVSFNLWEWHSFISVAPNAAFRHIQAVFEGAMHRNAVTELTAAKSKEVRDESELDRLEKTVALTKTGEQFLFGQKHQNMHCLIARAGDWTSRMMDHAIRNGVVLEDLYGKRVRYQTQIWARRYKPPGFGWTAAMSPKLVSVVTGGGAAGALPYMFAHLKAAQTQQYRRRTWQDLEETTKNKHQYLQMTAKLVGGGLTGSGKAKGEDAQLKDAAISAVRLTYERLQDKKAKPASAASGPFASTESSHFTFPDPAVRPWVHLIWVCRSPALNYREMFDAVTSLHPSMYTIIDTKMISSNVVAKYLPQLTLSAVYQFQAEQVTVVSGALLTDTVIQHCRNHWIPAYGATFDS